eukprot:TRINITY_DN81210_c0_g1_i1.p2 TRINITY_DN81210_c0_g1~~TRINITY_DN81210_c0_g1_i1.p2  ORF type:complete len:432 (+),score=109.18 TRINITY_DN81210_c0_g1_i1:69-1364(+)
MLRAALPTAAIVVSCLIQPSLQVLAASNLVLSPTGESYAVQLTSPRSAFVHDPRSVKEDAIAYASLLQKKREVHDVKRTGVAGRGGPVFEAAVLDGASEMLEAHASMSLAAGSELQSERAQMAAKYGYEDLMMKSGGREPDIIFTHLLKAGGSSVQAILGDVMNVSFWYVAQTRIGSASSPASLDNLSTALHAQGVDVALKSPEEGGYFRIGMVRSPCDYLLSMWTFQSTGVALKDSSGHGDFPRNCLKETVGNDYIKLYGKDNETFFDTDADKQRFRQWVKVTAGRHMHQLSLRSFLASKLRPSPHQDWDDGQIESCFGRLSDQQEQTIADALATTDLNKRYDCLIHTEALEEETFACLNKFGGLIKDEHVRKDFLEKVSQSKNKKSYLKNKSKHASCKDYYDKDTEAFVWQREKPFAQRLGYASCCAPA